MQTESPILSIGIIFKNESRCLERCLNALSPLRDAIPCELIMADTGSSDCSREIASDYADVLFDFPWNNDFSAARNAVMNRAAGKWHMYIDADECLDNDIDELIYFLRNYESHSENLCAITIRNYETAYMGNRYSDFTAVRLIRASLGVRFHGAIHEAWDVREDELQNICFLSHTILHHDGYIGLDEEAGAAKKERNLTLLRDQIKKTPDDLKTLLQYIESAKGTPEYLEIIRRASDAVENKHLYWENLGAPIFRYAVRAALEEGLPEFGEWVLRAEKWFPDSLFTRIDVAYMAFLYNMKHGNYVESICRGTKYLQAMDALSNSNTPRNELAYSTLLLGSPYWEQDVKLYLSDIYTKTGSPQKAQELLQSVKSSLLDESQTETMLRVLGDLQRLSLLNTAPILLDFFRGISMPVPSACTAQKRLTIFYRTAALAFLTDNIQEEAQEENFCRPSYTLFLPLGTENELGAAAMILQTEDVKEISQLLLEIKDWEKLPVEALLHALIRGVIFPLANQPLKSEEMDRLIARMAENKKLFFSALKCTIEKKDITKANIQEMKWTQAMILAAIHIYDWETCNTDEGLRLARAFAKSEAAALHRFYAPELFCAENLFVLPSLHRFGWYCAKAFDALNSGDPAGYIHELKSGVNTCPEANVIVEYLIKYTPELQPCQQTVSDELLTLAEQVRSIMSGYPAGAPEIETLKASPAYQKVAWLIEGVAGKDG